jgi:predicted Kef-type K+ transport protein
MPKAIWISFAFGLGLLVKAVHLPPLVGYLAAVFALSALTAFPGFNVSAGPTDV